MDVFKKYDWVTIRNSKKAHILIQGYNGLTTPCHSTGIVEQQEMQNGVNKEKCKICEKYCLKKCNK